MSEYREIIEPEYVPPTPVHSTRRSDQPRGKATIIQGPGKCKRLHFDGVRIAICVVALGAIATGAGHGYGIDAALLCGGAALALLAASW